MWGVKPEEEECSLQLNISIITIHDLKNYKHYFEDKRTSTKNFWSQLASSKMYVGLRNCGKVTKWIEHVFNPFFVKILTPATLMTEG